jgi:hypothetical protein
VRVVWFLITLAALVALLVWVPSVFWPVWGLLALWAFGAGVVWLKRVAGDRPAGDLEAISPKRSGDANIADRSTRRKAIPKTES